MTIWREFRGGGAPVQVARRVGRMLRSGIGIVLCVEERKREREGEKKIVVVELVVQGFESRGQ